MECGNQETQRREGVSNGVREDTEVRRGEKAGNEWTGIIQMGKRPRDGTKTTNRTRVRAKKRGQLDMVRRDGRRGSNGQRHKRTTKREDGGQARRDGEIDEKVGGYRRQGDPQPPRVRQTPTSGRRNGDGGRQAEQMKYREDRNSETRQRPRPPPGRCPAQT